MGPTKQAILRKVTRWLPALAIVELVVAGACCLLFDFGKGPLEEQSTSKVVGGLHLSIQSLGREGDQLHVRYALRWVGEERRFVFHRPWGGINAAFWDAEGGQIGNSQFASFSASDAFRFGRAPASAHTAEFAIPPGAEAVSIMVGTNEDTVTRRVRIPR